MQTTPDDLREAMREMVLQGRLFVRDYAARYTPTVDPDLLQKVVAAVGEISLSEAVHALHRATEKTREVGGR